MDPQQEIPQSSSVEELKELMRQNIALAQENNKMLHAVRRGTWLSYAVRLLWIVAIIVASYYSYLYLQPYLQKILGLYGNIQNLQEQAQNAIQQFQGGGTGTTTNSR
ncbi:MAG TPA: hypothetical protein VG934_00420 [Candidatus Paceibacterota bacterium]|nr:hypothetical protein [Candidatus Paceibacterota bacterium]